MTPTIDTARCIACNVCREVCPRSAVRVATIDGVYHYEIHVSVCDECAAVVDGPLCRRFCPIPGAIVEPRQGP